jgi:hypothetical protein
MTAEDIAAAWLGSEPELEEVTTAQGHAESDVREKPFVIQMTKPQFERELGRFVNKSGQPWWTVWRVLLRRLTEQDRRQCTRMELEYKDWEPITNITEADAIKLTCDPYRGLVLELTEKEAGLWVVVNSEGDRESVTVREGGTFRHKGYKHISVNPEAHSVLLAWLKSLDLGTSTVKILFLAANPKDTERLRLDEEIREIKGGLRQSKFRDQFDIEQHWAVRVSDVQGHLLHHSPDIVHFSSHGSASDEIILEDNSGNSQPVSSRALSELFSILKDNIRCVVLNACYSEQQAKAIAEHIDCVVGMSKGIGDSAAISFAAAFYRALGFGRDVETAFKLGRAQIDLENLGAQDIPKLLAVRSDPAKIVFVHED